MKKQDTRIQYTKTMFHNAMLELLKEKNISKIKINELCETAGLNRGTFYLHYSELQDVIKEIEDDFIATNMSFFNSYWNENNNYDFIEQLFSFVLQHKELFRTLMGENTGSKFALRLKQLVFETTVNGWQQEISGSDRYKMEFLFDYVYSGSISLILSWIDDDKGISAPEFAHRLECLGHYCLIATSEF